MILFQDEEKAYLSWVSHHRQGYVLDVMRRPSRRHLVLHRASCDQIRKGGSKATRWTTGKRMKVCSLRPEELHSWAVGQTGAEPQQCEHCHPDRETTAEQLYERADHSTPPHLTKLGSEIVDFVLEAAIIFLDGGEPAFRITVRDVAHLLDRSEAQVTLAIVRLIEDGFLAIEGSVVPGKPLTARRVLYPTEQALRTVPAFAELAPRAIQAEIRKLNENC